MGCSNYLCYSCDLRFTNNPFEYNHHEEQYITNPKAKILLDYNATLLAKSNIPKAYNTLKASPRSFSSNSSLDYNVSHIRPVIATYEFDYKKGTVIGLGIYSGDVINNHRFQNFFDSLLFQYVMKARRD